MTQIGLENGPNYLTYAVVQNQRDPALAVYANACASNNVPSALSLSTNLDTGTVTFGLNIAVQRGHLELARQLLNAGAEWDAFTIEYALAPSTHMVVGHNDEACIQYLLERGANPSFGPKRRAPGHITEHRAVMNSGSILTKAAMECSPEIFALLRSHGSDLSHDGTIPLHCAAGHPLSRDGTSRIPMLEYLVDELGIDVNAMDDAIKIYDQGQGQTGTPLYYAVKCGHFEEVKWLLDRGADPDLKTTWGGYSARDQAKILPPGHAIRVLFEDLQPKT
ncbi:ankyrin [Bimuria novae-zelandiae CBS 107.79]|uniref:Ankyrin n=1 Tax=Bimuria novae-zelandiae CBS 107.79 TaxID=1447943 RepID=A0A6A5UTB0_9PLEO|nr:ankyrin [Bimuria novae-zelandiae CBS 107.79]